MWLLAELIILPNSSRHCCVLLTSYGKAGSLPAMGADGRASKPPAFLAGGGEAGLRMRNLDWQATGLGPPEHGRSP